VIYNLNAKEPECFNYLSWLLQ